MLAALGRRRNRDYGRQRVPGVAGGAPNSLDKQIEEIINKAPSSCRARASAWSTSCAVTTDTTRALVVADNLSPQKALLLTLALSRALLHGGGARHSVSGTMKGTNGATVFAHVVNPGPLRDSCGVFTDHPARSKARLSSTIRWNTRHREMFCLYGVILEGKKGR